jgi:uncharacterized protein YegP (UPF0339 family)
MIVVGQTTVRTPTWEVSWSRNSDGVKQFWARLNGGNGAAILGSETYTRKAPAVRAVQIAAESFGLPGPSDVPLREREPSEAPTGNMSA